MKITIKHTKMDKPVVGDFLYCAPYTYLVVEPDDDFIFTDEIRKIVVNDPDVVMVVQLPQGEMSWLNWRANNLIEVDADIILTRTSG